MCTNARGRLISAAHGSPRHLHRPPPAGVRCSRPAPARTSSWSPGGPRTCGCPPGKVLVTEGETGHEFFVILDGTAKVTRQGRTIATLGPGDAFGELALLEKAPRNATVVAETDMELVVLGQREFAGIIDEVPGFARKLLAGMAKRLREADATIGSVARSARIRLASTPAVDSARVRRPRPHQIVLVVGVARRASFTIASGIMPAHHAVARRLDRSHARSSSTSRPAQLGLLHHGPDRCCSCRVARVAAVPELRAGRPRRPAHDQEERRAAPRATSARACGCRRCCAIPPPGSCTPASTSASSSSSSSR